MCSGLTTEVRFDIFDPSKTSSWMCLFRITTWIQRFVANCRRRFRTLPWATFGGGAWKSWKPVSKKRPRNILFIDDLTRLKKGKEFHSSSHLSSFSPYIDEKGILRVGGRLKHAPIQTEAKYPAILPRDHPITNLIVTHLHRKLKHSGTEHVSADLRQRFWVPKAR